PLPGDCSVAATKPDECSAVRSVDTPPTHCGRQSKRRKRNRTPRARPPVSTTTAPVIVGSCTQNASDRPAPWRIPELPPSSTHFPFPSYGSERTLTHRYTPRKGTAHDQTHV